MLAQVGSTGLAERLKDAHLQDGLRRMGLPREETPAPVQPPPAAPASAPSVLPYEEAPSFE